MKFPIKITGECVAFDEFLVANSRYNQVPGVFDDLNIYDP
jgi:hypothetical protein